MNRWDAESAREEAGVTALDSLLPRPASIWPGVVPAVVVVGLGWALLDNAGPLRHSAAAESLSSLLAFRPEWFLPYALGVGGIVLLLVTGILDFARIRRWARKERGPDSLARRSVSVVQDTRPRSLRGPSIFERKSRALTNGWPTDRARRWGRYYLIGFGVLLAAFLAGLALLGSPPPDVDPNDYFFAAFRPVQAATAGLAIILLCVTALAKQAAYTLTLWEEEKETVAIAEFRTSKPEEEAQADDPPEKKPPVKGPAKESRLRGRRRGRRRSDGPATIPPSRARPIKLRSRTSRSRPARPPPPTATTSIESFLARNAFAESFVTDAADRSWIDDCLAIRRPILWWAAWATSAIALNFLGAGLVITNVVPTRPFVTLAFQADELRPTEADFPDPLVPVVSVPLQSEAAVPAPDKVIVSYQADGAEPVTVKFDKDCRHFALKIRLPLATSGTHRTETIVTLHSARGAAAGKPKKNQDRRSSAAVRHLPIERPRHFPRKAVSWRGHRLGRRPHRPAQGDDASGRSQRRA